MTSLNTTMVGSYPIPSWLRSDGTRDSISDATAVVLHLQEQAGIDLYSDGELPRYDINHPETNGMIEHFVHPLGGVRSVISRTERAQFAEDSTFGFRRRAAGVVEAAITEGTSDLPGEFATAQQLTSRPLKFTMTSPYMLARTLLDTHYGDRWELTHAVANVLAQQARDIPADVLQVDEANLPGQPQDAAAAAEAVNVVLDAAAGIPAVHLCFGNYGGQRIQPGRLRALRPFFAALHADHVVLETARPGADDLQELADIDNIRFGVGVIDVKDTQVETADQVAARIDRAATLLGDPDRIAYVNPDCGLWNLPRSVANAKLDVLVAGRDRYRG